MKYFSDEDGVTSDSTKSDEGVPVEQSSNVKQNADTSSSDDGDYFKISYDPESDSIECNSSINFDSQKFLDHVKQNLASISDKAKKHTYKLFLTRAFKIPMNVFQAELGDESFTDKLESSLKSFDLPERGKATIGFSSEDSAYQMNPTEQEEFDEADAGAW